MIIIKASALSAFEGAEAFLLALLNMRLQNM